ncbi:MAG: hypothetical protein IPM97_15375 [Bdellovibrionaceae bacterium]|nr:hypothetical protein [Pseudobdellovibrionaceae bacterium]
MIKLLVVSFTILAISNPILASGKKSIELKCPDRIKVYAKVQEVPRGWQSWDVAEEGKNAIKSLSAIDIYEGHPGKKVLLAPSNADSKEKSWLWTFSPFGEKRKSPIWIACKYEDTQMLIVQSLPTKIIKCQTEAPVSDETKKIGTVSCDY